MIYENYIHVLHIDLDTEKIRIRKRPDLMEYLGGVGVAAKLLEEHMRPDLPPLASEQPIVLAIGALSTIYPVVTKTIATFISPLTGEYGETHGGGRLALAMFEAGYDAMVITGRASRLMYLSVSNNDIFFRDARPLSQVGVEDTGRIIREREISQSGKRSIICIGPGGENLVSYSNVTVDLYRHFGRLGLGALFGSKQLKAIQVMGNRSIPIKNFKEYFKVYREIYDKATEPGGSMSKYHDTGTPINIEPLSAMGALPTRNLQLTSFEHAEEISGEVFANSHLAKKMACTGCPVGCIHIGQFRREFSEVGHEYETVSVSYDYELIFALGTFLGMPDSRSILELIEKAEDLGLDAMSTGVALGWATEALEKGFISLDDTQVQLSFGELQSYRSAIEYIAGATNDFYRHLGQGVKHASEVYGGEDFAMHIAGNEMPGYHTGHANLAGVVVGSRHSHLCNGGYSLDQSLKSDIVDTQALADALYKEELERCMLNSLIMCLFARKVYDRPTILKALAAIGREYTDEDLSEICQRILVTKLRIKKALGASTSDVRLPKRFFETPSMHGKLDESTTREVIERFNAHLAKLEHTV